MGRLRIGNGEMLLVTMDFSEYPRQGTPTDFLANSGCNSGRIGYGSRRPATFFGLFPYLSTPKKMADVKYYHI